MGVKNTSKAAPLRWKAEYAVDRSDLPPQAVVIVVVAKDWWEARERAVQQLALAPEAAFSPALLVSRKR